MAAFRLRLLGAFALSGSAPCTVLSKKAQALLAYLALPPGQPHRREKLASMLWSDRSEAAARQNLRQCLAAIRKASNTGELIPVIAEGDLLRLDPANISIDVCEFEQALRNRESQELSRAFALYQGDLLEGANLPSEQFEEWLIGERRRLRALAIQGLGQLLELQQKSGARQDAMQTALRLVTIDPLQEAVHRTLMRLYHDAGNTAQALRQYSACEKILRRELNVEPEVATKELRRQILHSRSASPRSTYEESGEGSPPDGERSFRKRSTQAPPLKQDIHYCVTVDGVRIAYAVTGNGPPLVKVANWLTHLEHDHASPASRHLLDELSREHTLIRYDPRGNGLSDWDVEDLSLDGFLCDLESVIEAVGLDRFLLYGMSQGASFAAAYAARHSRNVSGLILCNGFVRGWRKRLDPSEVDRRKALSTLILQGWGQDNPAYRQIFSSLLMPGANAEHMYWLNELQRLSTSPENAHKLHEAISQVDVSDLLDRIEAPTLILHARDDAMIPFSQGQAYAAGISGSRFVPLDSRNHVLLPEEPAWQTFQAELRTFLRQCSSAVDRPIGADTPESATPDQHDNGLIGDTGAPAPADEGRAMLPLPDRPSIAVLPFADMSGDPAQEYFADGLSEDLITSLARIRWLFVIAPNSSLVYKGRTVDVKRVARELGVRYLLEGSLRRSGSRLRVNARLVDAVTGARYWAEHYDREQGDLFALQDEITRSVASAIEPRLLAAEGVRALSRSSGDLNAWELVARAQTHFWRLTGPDYQAAIEPLAQAVDAYPDYAPAHSLLGFCLVFAVHMGWIDREALTSGHDHARRAIELDDCNPWAHIAFGYTAMMERRTEESIAAFRRAVALNPNSAAAQSYLCHGLGFNGQDREAIEHGEQAIRLSPLDPEMARFLGGIAVAHYTVGRFAEAVKYTSQALRLRPGFQGAQRLRCASLAQLGCLDEARASLAATRREHPQLSLDWIRDNVPYQTPELLELFVDGMRKAGLSN